MRPAMTVQAQASMKSSLAAPRGGLVRRNAGVEAVRAQAGRALADTVRIDRALDLLGVHQRPAAVHARRMPAPDGFRVRAAAVAASSPHRFAGSCRTGKTPVSKSCAAARMWRAQRRSHRDSLRNGPPVAEGMEKTLDWRAPSNGRTACSGPRPPLRMRSGRPMGMSMAIIASPEADSSSAKFA